MYTIYREVDGFSNGDLAVVTFAYLLAVVLSLLFSGRMSDHVGRKPVGIVALGCALAGTALLIWVHDPRPMVLARTLQGLACGMSSSSLSAYVTETTPRRWGWFSALIAGSFSMIGISSGALLSGALIEYGPYPRRLIFVVTVTMLLVWCVLLARCPEPVGRSRGALRSLVPQLRMPTNGVGPVITVCLAFVACWPIGGFYQTYAPVVVTQYLGTSNALIAAAVFVSVFVLNPLSGPIVGKRFSTAWVNGGMLVYTVALVGLSAALHAGSVPGFLTAGLMVGLAQGVASISAMGAVIAWTLPAERAGVLASIYLIAYLSTTLSVAGAGYLTNHLDLDDITSIYVGFGIVAAIATVVSARVQGRTSAGAPAAPVRSGDSSGLPGSECEGGEVLHGRRGQS